MWHLRAFFKSFLLCPLDSRLQKNKHTNCPVSRKVNKNLKKQTVYYSTIYNGKNIK